LAFPFGQMTTIPKPIVGWLMVFIMSKNSGIILRSQAYILHTLNLHNIVHMNCDHGGIAVSIITISYGYINEAIYTKPTCSPNIFLYNIKMA